MPLPLEGVRILDFSHVLSGPYTTHMLGTMGALIIKIERPGIGDGLRDLAVRPQQLGLAPAFAGCNAGKRSLAVDFTTAAGRTIIERLVRNSQVLVENFKPGELARRGLGTARIAELNPDMICCSISAWGRSGPWAERGGYDHVMQAATGMMMLQGASDEEPPTKVGFPAIDVATGMLGTIAVLGALMRKRAGEQGPINIDLSMADASLMLMGPIASRYLNGGQAPERVGNAGFVGSPGANVFPTADGWIAVAANTLSQFDALCAVLGHPEFATAPDYLSMRPKSPGAMLRGLATPALHQALCQASRAHSSAQLEERLNAAAVPASGVRSLADYLDGPYRNTPGIGARVPEPRLGTKAVQEILGLGFRWNGAPSTIDEPAPTLGEHSDAVLQELGYNDGDIAQLRQDKVIA
jgi:crotonobetainyl-CoA:carnitine CoA-transferase CaiB-like acyl-CoA transferase